MCHSPVFFTSKCTFLRHDSIEVNVRFLGLLLKIQSLAIPILCFRLMRKNRVKSTKLTFFNFFLSSFSISLYFRKMKENGAYALMEMKKKRSKPLFQHLPFFYNLTNKMHAHFCKVFRTSFLYSKRAFRERLRSFSFLRSRGNFLLDFTEAFSWKLWMDFV